MLVYWVHLLKLFHYTGLRLSLLGVGVSFITSLNFFFYKIQQLSLHMGYCLTVLIQLSDHFGDVL